MKERKFPFVYVLLIIIAAVCLCGFIIQSRENVKSYVRFDGKYYYGGGATLDPAFLGEEAGEIERSAPRSIFNRNGDSNFFEPGAYIPGDGSSLHPELGSAITGLAIVSDTTVAPIETVHGKVAFLQLVGLTQPELNAVTRDPDALTGILERMRAEDPELVLDMRRTKSYI